jgi:nucleolysin TIA-1/TIAR
VKLDTSNHHHIFVGDLSPEIDNETLRNAFAPFGEISDCKVVKDPQTLKSKGKFLLSATQLWFSFGRRMNL